MRCSAAPCSCRGLARRASRQALRQLAAAPAAHHAATQQQHKPAPAMRRHTALHAAEAPPTPAAAAAQSAASDAPATPHATPCGARRSLVAAAAALLLASPSATRAAEPQPAGVGAAAGGSAPAGASADDAAAATAVVPYRDDANHFSLERPAAWVQTSKAGASVLFKDPTSMISTLGVTVSPVLVKTLADFGTLEEVTAKLVAAERDKESTLSVEVLSTRERRAASGATLYEIDYLLDSSRGKKRVINAVCIDAATLYIYALQFKAADDQPVPAVASIAPQLLASFEPGR